MKKILVLTAFLLTYILALTTVSFAQNNVNNQNVDKCLRSKNFVLKNLSNSQKKKLIDQYKEKYSQAKNEEERQKIINELNRKLLRVDSLLTANINKIKSDCLKEVLVR